MIEFAGVSRYHNKSWPTLDNITLSIGRGEFVLLTGRSGAGKTTFLYHIYMKERPTAGRVTVDSWYSDRMRSDDVAELRRRVGMVFQEFHLLNDRNVFENIALPLRLAGQSGGEIRKRTFDVLAYTGLSHKMNDRPLHLSSGEKQRICLARAIVSDPLVLLADEPTGNLDDENSADLLSMLRNINGRGTAVVLATHNTGLMADLPCRRIRMESGKIVEDRPALTRIT